MYNEVCLKQTLGIADIGHSRKIFTVPRIQIADMFMKWNLSKRGIFSVLCGFVIERCYRTTFRVKDRHINVPRNVAEFLPGFLKYRFLVYGNRHCHHHKTSYLAKNKTFCSCLKRNHLLLRYVGNIGTYADWVVLKYFIQSFIEHIQLCLNSVVEKIWKGMEVTGSLIFA
jgi:hypothetical protein